MARKAAPKHVEPEEESQEIPEEEPETEEEQDDEPETAGKSMSKADACRAALADGITETEDAVRFAKTRFGIDIKPTDFTLYKSKEKKKQGEAAPKGKPGRKPKGSGPPGGRAQNRRRRACSIAGW